MVTALRSLLFQVAFHLVTTLYLFVFLPLLPLLSRRTTWRVVVVSWARLVGALLRIMCGTRVEVRGRENIPDGPLLIAAKHQSAWETIAFLPMFADPTLILKKELMRIPLFGWYLRKAEMIPVDRAGGMGALKAMTRQARAEIARGRQILIFPEGTRRAPGAAPDYKPGIANLYNALNVPCLPVAHNAGLYWPRRAIIRRAGTIRVEILPPIPPGLGRAAFMAELERTIEAASDRLLLEGLDELGARAPGGVAASRVLSPLSTTVDKS